MFHFKKFSIDDNAAAMKIGTDAVILGSWVLCENETRILDIGTGSGILALMMAQRNNTTAIDAVEIDPVAASLATQNVKLSPWTGQIQIFSLSIQEFSAATKNKYSLIISNPPFFTDSLKAPDKARNMARHNDILPVKELLECTSNLLEENGKAAFILPADAFENWKQEAAKLSLYPAQITFVKSSPNHKAHRVLVTFTRNKLTDMIENEFSIYICTSVYSNEYKGLTKDFYLTF